MFLKINTSFFMLFFKTNELQAKVTTEHPNSQTLSTRDLKNLHSEWSLHTKI